ncbi:winged helix-turn-helix domain-containing protein [uncultured Brevundimonas sp.]|uniref:winged helix-turn-helix domain-containing tetratricopeptide repeat protein n=1 Tax=uncultured Brevundimonas sp. TaxID=213418 RepID=UPI0026023514|nr:winged helix-turn-helix domain-containing protein [uncultured Brevundimonas sp.]
MIYAFEDYRLDIAARELRRGAAMIPVEPQVFALLTLLVENRQRLVSREEIIEKVWNGRSVSESALDSRIKSARQAIGDDGRAQRLIRTQHGVGFRFVGAVTPRTEAAVVAEGSAGLEEESDPAPLRPSIAVLPFSLVGIAGPYGAIAHALPHDLIVELSRLRWLFVVARASSFQLRGAALTPAAVKAALGVSYCLSGVVELEADGLTVRVELCETADGSVLWSERYRSSVGGVHEIREEISCAVVAALELQIPLEEARRALKTPENLDAWAAYHLGLGQMYQFSRDGAERAATLFAQAIDREPGFARAFAGLSFAHFEGAFLRFASDRAAAALSARRFAERSLELDPLDPFCNLVMGRAAWLTGDLEGALPWLDRAVELNPNYAQGKYSSAWTRTLLGEGGNGRALTDAAMSLSPLDPLRYGMLGVRAFSHLVLDERAEAASWGERAARAPHAHPLIELVAAVGHGLNGDHELARAWANSARKRQPGIGVADFLEAFPFREAEVRNRISGTLRGL